MIPHLRYPFRVGATVATVDQGSPDEIAQCVYAVLATRRGERVENPTYGTPSYVFRQGGVDEIELRQIVDEHEPRASILTDSQFTGLAQTVGVAIQ